MSRRRQACQHLSTVLDMTNFCNTDSDSFTHQKIVHSYKVNKNCLPQEIIHSQITNMKTKYKNISDSLLLFIRLYLGVEKQGRINFPSRHSGTFYFPQSWLSSHGENKFPQSRLRHSWGNLSSPILLSHSWGK